MKIVLMGYMGSGKSSVGEKLAAILKTPFIDLDLEIEKREGLSVADIFKTKGEIYFRKIENMALKEILTSEDSFILATGGGTPCYGDAITTITTQANLTSIYLKVPLDILTQRLFAEKNHRPLLSHLKTEEEINDFIRKHLFERAYFYNQASIIVENGNEGIDKTLEDIVSKLL